MNRKLTRLTIALLFASLSIHFAGCSSTGWFRPKEDSSESARQNRKGEGIGFFEDSVMEERLFGDD